MPNLALTGKMGGYCNLSAPLPHKFEYSIKIAAWHLGRSAHTGDSKTVAIVYIKMKSGTEHQGLILACLYPFGPSLPLPSCSDLPFLFPLFPSILPLDSFNSKSYLVPQILYAALMTRSARNSSCHLLTSALEAAGNVTFGSCLGDLGIKILDSWTLKETWAQH